MRRNVEHNFKQFMGSKSNYKKLKNTFPLRLYKISDDYVNVARLYFDALVTSGCTNILKISGDV